MPHGADVIHASNLLFGAFSGRVSPSSRSDGCGSCGLVPLMAYVVRSAALCPACGEHPRQRVARCNFSTAEDGSDRAALMVLSQLCFGCAPTLGRDARNAFDYDGPDGVAFRQVCAAADVWRDEGPRRVALCGVRCLVLSVSPRAELSLRVSLPFGDCNVGRCLRSVAICATRCLCDGQFMC